MTLALFSPAWAQATFWRCNELLTAEAKSDFSQLVRLSKYEKFVADFSWRLGIKRAQGELSVPAIYRRLLVSDPRFVSFVATESNRMFANISPWEQRRLIGAYGQYLAQIYSGESFTQKQNSQLLEELRWRGYKTEQSNGRLALKELSRENRARLMEELQVPADVSSQTKQAVEGIRFFYAHNTAASTALKALPLLSSKELVENGYYGGSNTARFNNWMLRSHGNVFFRAYTVGPKADFRPIKDLFGENAMILDRDFAKDHSWVSPYLMYEYQLPRVLEGIAESTGEDIWSSNVQILYKMDFTVADYEDLVRAAMTVELESLRKENLSEYLTYVETLQGSEVAHLVDLVSKKHLHIPQGTGMELKVPVAVPFDKLEFLPQ